MENQVKTFNQFIVESYDEYQQEKYDKHFMGAYGTERQIALVTLEFDWTWADQKEEKEALEEVESLLRYLPTNIEIDDLELDGWDRDYDEPDYSTPYLVELTLAFRGDRDSFTADLSVWLESTQLLELYAIDFN